MTTTTLYGNPEAIKLLRDLRGAPLSCLIGLYIEYPHPLGRAALQTLTRYSKDAITAAMNLLVNVHCLVAKVGRFEAWCLTDKGYQLRLPLFSTLFGTFDARAPIDGGKTALDGSSSRSLILDLSLYEASKTTTTPQTEDGKTDLEHEKIALSDEALELIEIYLRGCNRAASTSAVRTALERGDSLKDIESEMILWVSYAESPLGKGIRGPAVLAASKIKAGEKCPDFLWRVDTNDRKTGAAWMRWKDAQAPWLERLDELWETKPRGGLIQMSDAMRRAMEQREVPAHED